MNSKSLKKAMININNRNNSKIEKEIKLPKNISNRNNKITNSISFNNSSINASRITSNKLKNHFSLSKNKYPQLNCDYLKNNNDDSDILKDNLIKTKEQYNAKTSELTNDSNFATTSQIPTQLSQLTNKVNKKIRKKQIIKFLLFI